MRIAITVNGQDHIVEFDRQPTDADIEDVASQMGWKAPKATAPQKPASLATGPGGVPLYSSADLNRDLAPLATKTQPQPKAKSNPKPSTAPAPGTTEAVALAKSMAQNGILGGLLAGPLPPAQGQGAGILINNQGGYAPPPVKSKGPLVPKDFANLNFDYDSFMYGLRNGRSVQTRSGNEIPLGKAATLVAKHTGKSIPNVDTTTQSQQEQAQEMDAYTGGGTVGVGKTVGFNKNQNDSQVPKGAKAKIMASNAKAKSQTQALRDTVNQYTAGIGQTIQDAAKSGIGQTVLGPLGSGILGSELGSGLIAGAVTSPLSLGADFRTMADTTETAANQAGASANVAIALGTELLGKTLVPFIGKRLQGTKAYQLALNKIKGTPVEDAIIHAPDEASATHTVEQMGVTPEHAEEIAQAVRQPFNSYDAEGNPTYTPPDRTNRPAAVNPQTKVANPIESPASVAPPVEGQGAQSLLGNFSQEFKPSEPGPRVSVSGDNLEVTGLTMAQRQLEADKYGTPEPESVTGLTNAEAHAIGKRFVEEHGDGPVLANLQRLSEESRPARTDEIGQFIEVRRRLMVERANAEAALKAAAGTPEHEHALAVRDAVADRIQDFDGHFDNVKGAGGQSLQALKIGTTLDEGQYADAATYHAAAKSEVERVSGKSVRDKVDAQLKILTQKLKEKQARLEELEASAPERRANRTFQKGRRAGQTVEQIKARRAAALSKAAEAWKTAGAEVDRQLAGQANSLLPGAKTIIKGGTRLYEIAPHVIEVAKTVADEGVLRLSDAVEKVRGHLAGVGVDLSEQDVHNILTGNYERPPSAANPDTARSQVNQWRDELKKADQAASAAKREADRTETQRINQIVKESQQEDALKANAERKAKQAEIDAADKTARNARRQQFKDALKDHDEKIAEAAAERARWAKRASDAEKRQAYSEAADARIKERDAYQQIKNEAAQKAREERKAAAKEYEKLFGERNRLDASIQDLNRRIKENDFGTKPKAERDPELAKEYFERDQLRTQLRALVEAQRPKGLLDKPIAIVRDIASFPRTIKTSFDLSAPLRQAAMLSINRPLLAAKAFRAQLTAFADPVFAHEYNLKITHGENAPIYKKAGLYLSDSESAKISQHEEEFVSRLAGKIPGVKGSERAYTTYLNTMRAATFDALRSPGMTDKELQGIANFINVSTGRGSLGSLDNAANGFAQIFFSPRNLASRFQLLAGQPLVKSGSLRNAGRIAAEYAKFASAIIAVMAFAKNRGAEVNFTNPDDPDWMKIKIGDTRIDMLAGLQQSARYLWRQAHAQGIYENTKVGADFVRSKLAPTPGYLVSAKFGTAFGGQPFDAADSAKDSVTPLIAQDTFEAMKAQGIPAGIGLGILSGLGVGVSTYKSGQQDENIYDAGYRNIFGSK